MVQFPCKICFCPAVKSHDSIQCDKCNIWVRRECNKINKQADKLVQKDQKSKWFCIICTKEYLTFLNLSNEDFIHTIKSKNIKFTHAVKKKVSNETEFFNQINSERNMFENLSKYVTPNELKQFAKK